VFRRATVDGRPVRAQTREVDGVTYTVVEVGVQKGRSARVAVLP
jgi:hypothetical protein